MLSVTINNIINNSDMLLINYTWKLSKKKAKIDMKSFFKQMFKIQVKALWTIMLVIESNRFSS